MTFTNFLQVLAFNLLSNTLPLCILLYITAWLIAKLWEKRLAQLIVKIISFGKKDKFADED